MSPNDPVRFSSGVNGESGDIIESVVVTDIQDGNGDSVLDSASDALRVLVVDSQNTPFRARDNQATAQTSKVLQAAPGGGQSLFITDIIISVEAAMNIKLVVDIGGSPVDFAGPYYFAANGGASINLRTPDQVPANVNVGYTSVGDGNHTVEIRGYIAAAS